MSVEALFGRVFRFVEVRGEDECWPWTGYKNRGGYGRFMYEGKVRQAHRMVWMIANNAAMPPPSLVVMHSCDNRECCNPKHLSLGTQLENIADRHKKRRSAGPKGERNHAAKVRTEDVIALRSGVISADEFKKEFDFSDAGIRNILQRTTWRHI